MLELTESTLMADPERAAEVLGELHRAGVQIAIDDFGTGYSSLAHLKRFPAGQIKLDRSFVRGLPEDEGDRAITGAVLAMAHSLGLDVVAEGVETAAQRELLRRMGCDELQGYLLGRPAPAADVTGWLVPGLADPAPAQRASSARIASITAR
jgi:diguanylate cyclase